MYQYSLSYFTDLFNYCLEVSDKSDVLQERLDILLDYISYFVFLTVSRGLFGQHKLIYSFLITASIMRQAGDIPPAEWSFLLRGAGAMTGQIAVRHTRRFSCRRLYLNCRLVPSWERLSSLSSSKDPTGKWDPRVGRLAALLLLRCPI
jgi:hypothetical protein